MEIENIADIKPPASLKSYPRWMLSKFLAILPSGSPEFIYTTILKPKILKNTANYILKFIIPKETKIKEGIFLELDQSDPVASGAIALGVYERYESELFVPK